MAIVYGIVKQHGGEIRLTSDAGKGTTFEIFLPATCQAEIANSPPIVATDHLPKAGGETILVVEDEAFVREFVETLLCHAGYHVLVASNGVEALHIWEEQKDN